MSVTQPTSKTLPARPGERLGERLGKIHRAWLQELQAVLDQVNATDPGIWTRWNAIRYIDKVFSGRFDRERSAIERLDQEIENGQGCRLWVAAELVAMVQWQLHHSVGLCQHTDEFSGVTIKLVKAAAHWFAEVEEVLGPLSWDELPIQARQDLSSVTEETSYVR